MGHKIIYRPDIDGLRALAVILVLGYHTLPSLIPAGFIGVDIFFVISGYLITGILLKSLSLGQLSLAHFYVRRIKRIFPALSLVLITSGLVGWFVLVSAEFELLGKHILAGAAFVSNIVLWREAGYFDASATSKPLLHLWSLGVEEQFYIFSIDFSPLVEIKSKAGFSIIYDGWCIFYHKYFMDNSRS